MRGREEGMSLPEILVAALLIGIALVPLLELYPGTLGFNIESEIETVLSAVAVRKMEEIIHLVRTRPVVFDASTKAGSAAATTNTCGASITIGSSANYLVIQIGVRGITAVSSVVVGSACNIGTAATLLLAQNNGAATRRSELWGLLNPPTGTVWVQVNMAASVRHSWVAASFKRVLSATPLGSSTSATATTIDPIVAISPRTANSMLVGGFMWDDDPPATITHWQCQTTIDTAASTGSGADATTHLAQDADQGDTDIYLYWVLSGAARSWVALAVELRGTAWDQDGTAACPDLPTCRLVWTTACDTSVVAVTVKGAGALRTVSVVACQDTDGNAICDSSERQVRYDAKVTSRP